MLQTAKNSALFLSVHIPRSETQNIRLLLTVTLYKRVHFEVKQIDQHAPKSHENKYFFVKLFCKASPKRNISKGGKYMEFFFRRLFCTEAHTLRTH